MSVKSKSKKKRTIRKHQWSHWSDSITSVWVRGRCREVGMRSTQLLAEELRGTVKWAVDYLMEEPLTLERLHDIVPPFMRQEMRVEHAVDEEALHAAYPKLSEKVLHELYLCIEGFLVVLIREGAEVAKANKLKSIQPKHVNQIRLKYFTIPDN